MSKISDAISLIKAGFTKDEIVEMFSARNEDSSANIETAEKHDMPAESITDTDKILEALDNLTKAVYANNLMNTEIKPNTESSVDVFAKILGGEVNGK